MTELELYRELWKRPLHQTCKVNEELGEFMVELNRMACGRLEKEKLIEETADVLVVLTGMAEALGISDQVNEAFSQKVNRTKSRMKSRKDGSVEIHNGVKYYHPKHGEKVVRL